MGGRDGSPSPALIAAQRRLEQLREQRLAERSSAWDGGRRTADRGPRSMVSGRLSFDKLRASYPNNYTQLTNHNSLPRPSGQAISLFPDLALGMLRKRLTATGRIWLLLRYLDRDGRGWVRIEVVQEKLTARDSKLRVCGRRQLRNLLQQGRGIFWERGRDVAGDRSDRLWLKSAAKVATALGVERLSGRPILLPVETLLDGIGQVRAHFYASFHSGRNQACAERSRSAKPISRDKLEQITGVPARTQRDYDRAAGVICQSNFAVGERYRTENFQERAWKHGRAAFPYLDHDGRFGPVGGRYVAWRLPNSYEGPHDSGPVGRIKKINRQIDLVNTGAQGNGLFERISKIFHTNGLEAGKAYNRDGTADIYWPAVGSPDNRRRWHALPARRKRR